MYSLPRLVAAGLAAVTLGITWAAEPSATSLHLAAEFPDCEAFRSGWLAQPVLALTSLAFVGAGVWMVGDRAMEERGRLLIGATTVAVGIGSFLGHSDSSLRTVDAITVKLLVLAFLVYGCQRRRGELARLVPVWLGMAGVAVAIEVLWPAAGNPALGLLVAAAAAVIWMSVEPHRRRRLAVGLAMLALAGLGWWLGQAGSSLCEPESLLQLHGAWHILAAIGVGLGYTALRNEMT